MKNIFFIALLFTLSSPVWAQDYPETETSITQSEEFYTPPSLPESDFEDVPREEQQYVPESPEEEFESEEDYEEYVE